MRAARRAVLLGLMVVGAALGTQGAASAAAPGATAGSSAVGAPAPGGASPNVWWYCQWIQTSPNGGQYWCERL